MNRNCFYVGNDESGVLIDVGISAKQVMIRLNNLKIKPEKIKAIFITHPLFVYYYNNYFFYFAFINYFCKNLFSII